MNIRSTLAALVILSLAITGAQAPGNAEASEGKSDITYTGSKFEVHFESVGLPDSVISSDLNPSGTKTIRTGRGHAAIFQSEELKNEGVAVASMADDTGLTLGLHIEHPENAQVFIDGSESADKTISQIHFQSLENSPNSFQIRTSREATAAEVLEDYGQKPSNAVPLMHLGSVSIDLRGLKAEFQKLNKIGRAAILPSVTTVRNMTFIPEDWVTAPFLGCSSFLNYEFKGDSRTWSTSSSAFRTKFDVAVDWNGGPGLTSTRTVGQTTLWHNVFGNRVLEKSATASNSSMVLTSISKTSTEVKFKTYQDVTNPICFDAFTNGIFFNLNWTVSRLGSYSVQGTYMPVPNHEAYISSSSTPSWVTVFQTVHQPFECLMAVVYNCTTTRINAGAF